MHIIIGIITALAGLVWALYRLQNAGVDLNSFNPFYWLRRRKWSKQLGIKPLHNLDSPFEAAALLVVGVATYDEEVTRELKADVINLFMQEFSISDAKASELFSASRYLLQDTSNLEADIKNILAPNKEKFTQSQKDSLFSMIEKASSFEGAANEKQQKIIDAIEKEFSQDKLQKW